MIYSKKIASLITICALGSVFFTISANTNNQAIIKKVENKDTEENINKYVPKIKIITCPDEFKDLIASSINNDNSLKKILKDHYVANHYPGELNTAFFIKENRVIENKEGRISQIQIFPKKYYDIASGKLVANDIKSPKYVQHFEIIGFKKVTPTQFKGDLTISVKNFSSPVLNFSSSLPSNINFLEDVSLLGPLEFTNLIKSFLLNFSEQSENLYKNFNSDDVILDSQYSPVDNDKEGIKKIRIRIIGNYFDTNGNLVIRDPSNQGVLSSVITLVDFAKDVLNNNEPITDTTNTIFDLDKEISLDKGDILPNSFFGSGAEIDKKKIKHFLLLKNSQTQKSYLNIAYAFNSGDFDIDSVKADNFSGKIEITISIPKYIFNGQIVNAKLERKTIISGFGQDLLNNNTITPSSVNTSFICGNNISFSNVSDIAPSKYKNESLLNELKKIEVLTNAPKNENANFNVKIVDRNDTDGFIKVEIFINSYIENGKLINKKLVQNTTISGFRSFSFADKYNKLIIYSVTGSILALILVASLIIYFAKRKNTKNMLIYEEYLIENNLPRPEYIKSYLQKTKSKKISSLIKQNRKDNIKLTTKNIEIKTLESKPEIDHKKTYEEYYNSDSSSQVKDMDMDEIFSNLTMDFDTKNDNKEENYEDTIDRLMNEIDDD